MTLGLLGGAMSSTRDLSGESDPRAYKKGKKKKKNRRNEMT